MEEGILESPALPGKDKGKKVINYMSQSFFFKNKKKKNWRLVEVMLIQRDLSGCQKILFVFVLNQEKKLNLFNFIICPECRKERLLPKKNPMALLGKPLKQTIAQYQWQILFFIFPCSFNTRHVHIYYNQMCQWVSKIL